MSIQKLSVRLVLAMLATDAICCVLGILTGQQGAIGPAVGCSIATTVGAGIILLMGRLGARENWRLFALTVMGFVLGELLLLYLLNVNDVFSISRQRWSVETAITQLGAFGLLLALPVLLAMRLWKLPNFHVTSRIIVTWDCIALLVAFAAAVTTAVLGNQPWSGVLWPVALMLVVMSTMVGLAFGRGGIAGPVWIVIRIASVIAAVAAVLLEARSLGAHGFEPREWFWIAAAVTFWLGHLNAMHLCPLSRSERWARWVAVVCMAAAMTLICVATWTQWDYSNPMINARAEAAQRWAAGTTIIAGIATLGVFLLSLRGMLQKPVQMRTESYATLAVTCPNCQTRQTLPTPSARCGQCEMQFELRVIEPRCSGCNYLLIMHKGDRCPECGFPINRPPGPVSSNAVDRGEVPGNLAHSPLGIIAATD